MALNFKMLLSPIFAPIALTVGKFYDVLATLDLTFPKILKYGNIFKISLHTILALF